MNDSLSKNIVILTYRAQGKNNLFFHLFFHDRCKLSHGINISRCHILVNLGTNKVMNLAFRIQSLFEVPHNCSLNIYQVINFGMIHYAVKRLLSFISWSKKNNICLIFTIITPIRTNTLCQENNTVCIAKNYRNSKSKLLFKCQFYLRKIIILTIKYDISTIDIGKYSRISHFFKTGFESRHLNFFLSSDIDTTKKCYKGFHINNTY